MKAWQVVTHPHHSPTWRRLRIKPPGRLENYGFLRPTEENLQAWRMVKSFAEKLGARVVVLQTPPSFGYSRENDVQVKQFFSTIERGPFYIGWEPRGTWYEHLEAVEEIVCKHNVIHIVDPLRRRPVICPGQQILYFRLHGLGGREVNYRYRYSDEDLEKLVELLDGYTRSGHVGEVYVMFNNVYMGSDAGRFKKLAGEKLTGCEVL